MLSFFLEKSLSLSELNIALDPHLWKSYYRAPNTPDPFTLTPLSFSELVNTSHDLHFQILLNSFYFHDFFFEKKNFQGRGPARIPCGQR